MTGDSLRYSMFIRWSDEDQVFIVALPEWEGRLSNWRAATHGETYEEAAKNGREVLEMLVDVALEHDRQLPEPRLFDTVGSVMHPVPA